MQVVKFIGTGLQPCTTSCKVNCCWTTKGVHRAHWVSSGMQQCATGCMMMQVFDDKGSFTEWFGDALGKSGPGGQLEDDWLETEKRVVVIHRLHQILEPFMLRRQVEDVESKLPPKVR